MCGPGAIPQWGPVCSAFSSSHPSQVWGSQLAWCPRTPRAALRSPPQVPHHCLGEPLFFIQVSSQKPEGASRQTSPERPTQNTQQRACPTLQLSPQIPGQSRGSQNGVSGNWGAGSVTWCLPGKHEDLNLGLQHPQKGRARRRTLVIVALGVGYGDRHTAGAELAGQTHRRA